MLPQYSKIIRLNFQRQSISGIIMMDSSKYLLSTKKERKFNTLQQQRAYHHHTTVKVCFRNKTKSVQYVLNNLMPSFPCLFLAHDCFVDTIGAAGWRFLVKTTTSNIQTGEIVKYPLLCYFNFNERNYLS